MYIDAEVTDSTINQDLEHALETLCHMMIMIPYLSSSVGEQYYIYLGVILDGGYL